jgi:tetratricopeptide (TPR) repeat protein
MNPRFAPPLLFLALLLPARANEEPTPAAAHAETHPAPAEHAVTEHVAEPTATAEPAHPPAEVPAHVTAEPQPHPTEATPPHENAPAHPAAAEPAHPPAEVPAHVTAEPQPHPTEATPPHESAPAHTAAAEPAHTAEHAAAGNATHANESEEPAHGTKSKPQSLSIEERESLMRVADTKLAAGDTESAMIAYRQVASATADTPEAAPALLGMARTYRVSGDGVKAAATYEHLISNYPDYTELPSALLELGRTLRALGTPRLAMARFYSVIHSTLKLPEAESDRYRGIVRTAQFEIAETHLAMGNYPEAIRFFNRLDLLDLPPADRTRARFKAAQARVFAGEKTAAVAALTAFIAADPDAPESPEARNLLAILLTELGQKEESVRVTLALLQHERSQGDTTDRWRTWQRRTGNQLANQFYQGGEFTSALLLYRALDSLDTAPEWRVPVLYQIALCQERLEQPTAAIATYDEIKKLAAKEPAPTVAEIARMSAWRASQIAWIAKTETEITALRPAL